MTHPDDFIVTMRDAIRAGYCAKGVRYFAERHGLDFSDLVRNGIGATALMQYDDAMVHKIIGVARERVGSGQ